MGLEANPSTPGLLKPVKVKPSAESWDLGIGVDIDRHVDIFRGCLNESDRNKSPFNNLKNL